MKRTLFLIAALALAPGLAAQAVQQCTPPPIAYDDPAMAEIDRMLVNAYLNHYCYTDDAAMLNAQGYAAGDVPAFSQEIMKARMATLDKETPFDLVYNSTVQGFIDLYAVRRRELSGRVLGMSQLYFPYFEEQLAKYGIPLEMKYLAIVESALNPSAISTAGAGGLWQFMVSTGKMYGLNVTSYQDERFDMYKSTDAACRYLLALYKMYDNWELALAAYNSGPGNVNKAIRRAGGAKDFWTIKPYLPKETQGYVPAFIAVNYVMNFAPEHNLYPKKPLITFFETDSVTVQQRVLLSSLASTLNMPSEDLQFLNATYRKGEIPANGMRHYLVLPVEKVGLFLANEQLVYEQSKVAAPVVPQPTQATATTSASEKGNVVSYTYETDWGYHKVRSGESLGKIAEKHNVSVAQLKKWNHIKGTVIHSGQKLKYQTRVKVPVYAQEQAQPVTEQPAPAAEEQPTTAASPETQAAPAQEKPAEAPQAQAPATTTARPQVKYTYYTIQPGDTLWSIANKYRKDGVTESSIKSLNKGLSPSRLQVGQKIKLKRTT